MQTQKRCWNCRDRKTACDRSRPTCRKCRERKETCLGYGIKLSWPRENDRRRFTRAKGHCLFPVQSGDLEFVNTSSEDIEVSQQLSRLHHSPKSYEMMWLSQLPRMTMGRADCTLTPPNGVTPVARLISSSYDADDLYGLLLRLSINDDEKPTLATRHAISALSYQHLDKDKALVYQTNAVCALQSSIEALVPSRAIQTMAASMLLSIFETLNFDSSSLGWSIFFCGTKTIARLVTQLHGTHYGDEALILDWIFYHDAMYKFSIRHWIKKDDDQTQLAGLTKVISKAIFAPERQTVVPILGCSLELLDLVCQAVDAVFDRDDPRHLSKAHIETIRSLEIRTRNAEQRHTSVSETALLELSYAANIAELYRLATLVYLCRVGRGAPHDSQGVQELVKESFTLLDRIKFCERPWPLFVIALEARTEESRQTVLTVLEESLRRRPLGSVYLTSRMIRDAWVQQDLRDGDIDPLILYNLVVSRNRVPPSFA
ncbi:fungal-specific transcription factor domain-containing protein [Truncatella angustata]|uniref:Fungal-specific transcription factor domain-containing protein n=1 Tax=Truncatella angustata TaxID=152316 RepID=A0A9P8U8K6_9PEZI|nr:fungal-specific transcription factor domain-containing protein [Truncatella angustata]KAH6645304.1 fungal-specific transcription factor domain-containing protein [Truncatella angustata]